MRQYVVSYRHPDKENAEFQSPFADEDKAIIEFRKIVREAKDIFVAAGDITVDEAETLVAAADAVMQAQLLAMNVNDEHWLTVGARHVFIIRLYDKPDSVEAVEAQESPATIEERLDELAKVVDGTLEKGAVIERRLEGLRLSIEREVKASIIIDLIEYGRKNFRMPGTAGLSDFVKGESNGVLHAILTTAGVPYEVVGELRPSKEWQNTHETMRMMLISGQEAPELTAYWLLDLHKSDPAPATQADFAEQIRPTSEQFVTAPETPNEWFDKQV